MADREVRRCRVGRGRGRGRCRVGRGRCRVGRGRCRAGRGRCRVGRGRCKVGGVDAGCVGVGLVSLVRTVGVFGLIL